MSSRLNDASCRNFGGSGFSTSSLVTSATEASAGLGFLFERSVDSFGRFCPCEGFVWPVDVVDFEGPDDVVEFAFPVDCPVDCLVMSGVQTLSGKPPGGAIELPDECPDDLPVVLGIWKLLLGP